MAGLILLIIKQHSLIQSLITTAPMDVWWLLKVDLFLKIW